MSTADRLPKSMEALKMNRHKEAKQAAEQRWKNSLRFAQATEIDTKLTPINQNYIKATQTLIRIQLARLTQLYTNHAPLNYYLYRIGRAVTPKCPNYPQHAKTVLHFIIQYPAYKK